jgi:hypothetical protein
VGLKSKKAHEKAQIQQPTSPPTLSASPPAYPPTHGRPPLEMSQPHVELHRHRLRCVLLRVPAAAPACSAAAIRPCLNRRSFLASAAGRS